MTIDLDAELENWARLVRVGRVAHYCGSAEKYFRAPAAENLETNEPARAPIPMNVRAGWACEFAWRKLPSINVRLLVSWHYVRNRAIDEAARRAKVPRHRAGFVLEQARAEIRMRLLTARFR
jgi:hypothetical protein